VSAVEEVRRAAASLVAAFSRGDLDAYFDCFTADATFLFHSTDAIPRRDADGRSPAPALRPLDARRTPRRNRSASVPSPR
jgi:ketosteroid isomerase-like protein